MVACFGVGRRMYVALRSRRKNLVYHIEWSKILMSGWSALFITRVVTSKMSTSSHGPCEAPEFGGSAER